MGKALLVWFSLLSPLFLCFFEEANAQTTLPESQVIAMTMSDPRLLIRNLNQMTDYLLRQMNHSPKEVRIAFIPTASNDSFFEINFFKMFFKVRGFIKNESWHVSVFYKKDLKKDRRKLLQKLQSQDILFVGGGQTKDMIHYWRKTGFDTILKELWEKGGMIFSGASAGLECWFEKGLTRSTVNTVEIIDTLGFLKGSCSPHYQEGIRKYYFSEEMSKAEAFFPGYGCVDGSALHFVGQKLVNVLQLGNSGKVYFYQKTGIHQIQ